MRHVLVLVTALAVLAAACGERADDPGAEALAGQAERIAELLDEGEDCRALEAARTLGTMAEDDSLDQDVQSAAATYADQARQQLTCEAPSTPPAPEPEQDPDPDPDPDPDGGDDGPEEPPGQGNGGGPPGDPNGGPPGQGAGRGEGPDDGGGA